MADISAHGIGAGLPDGFEGHIYRRVPTGVERSFPVAHFATFAIPAGTGDFGGGATTLMGPNDVFASLFEYGPESVGTKLFAHQGLPRTLRPEDFSRYTLRRGLPGQAGTQQFFTEGGRPFSLYVVLGSHARRAPLVGRVNDLLGAIAITPKAGLGLPAGTSARPTARAVQQWN
ncbi:MAG TPA: hypothetical protein VMU14_12580 [Acidimicrobiales bacterium]|nr:hypothetical protein [Acidimicrobiales bacterium]